MNKLWIVTKNEFYRYFISPLAYVYLISFLLLNGSFALYFGHFFERGQADLLPMFGYQPWLYLLFLPGISMRLWAEEFRTKTILQIITMPVSVTTLVWGKFLASWIFCALALALTFPFWITVNLLGTPDNSVIGISYLGSFLLAGCMLAISQTMSALTKNQVIALVLAVIVNLLFFLCGIEYVLQFFRGLVPLAVMDMIASFSFISHFDTIIHGLLEARDIIFFTSLILLFNFTTTLVISFKTAGTTQWLQSKQRGHYILAFLFLLSIFSGLNLLANNTLRRIQFDFSEEKLFTLTDATIENLNKLQDPVTAKLYYSPILGQKNPDIRLMFDRIRLLLQRYAALSNGNFSYRIYNPEPFSDVEDKALGAGLQPLPIIETSTNAYFGLTLTDELENQNVIPYFPLERQNFIEQDLTEQLHLLRSQKPKVGLLTSLPLYEEIRDNVTTPKWEITNLLDKYYNIIQIDESTRSLKGFDALIIAHPQKLSPHMEQIITDYTNEGGRILAFFDIASEASALVAPVHDIPKPSDFGKLPDLWGIRFHAESAVADFDNSSLVDATTNYKNNPVFTQDLIQFYLQNDSFNNDFKETKQLKRMMLTSASTFTQLPQASTFFIPLLKASDNSQLVSSQVVYKRVHPAEILHNFEKDAKEKNIAVRVISKDRSRPFEVIAVGDSDLLYDNFWAVHQTILETNYAIPVLDNANFVLNALDTLLGKTGLVGLRGKSDKNRSFTGVEKMRRQVQKDFKVKEKDIFDDIEKTRVQLQEIWGKKDFEGRENFTADELALIAGIRKKIEAKRRQLYEIRINANADIRHLQQRIRFLNIYAIPLLILLGMLIVLFANNHKHQAMKTPFSFNRRILSLGLTALICLIAGAFAVYSEQMETSVDYEGEPVFPKLSQKINEIEQISLQTNKQKLLFIKKDGVWQLEGMPHNPVYQERIRSFLSALLEAVFYEKKSEKMFNLGKYGLTPISVKGSRNTRIELKNAKGKNVQSFEVGKYDIDLGRGSKGAYLKFDNQFKVWLVNMDLIDLSLSPKEWIYSTLWNLRFGRLAEINGKTDKDFIADVAKELLNASLEKAETSLPANAKIIQKLNLLIENQQKVELTFYKKDNNYYVKYSFIDVAPQSTLAVFKQHAENIYYQINPVTMEKLNNVIDKRPTK